MNREQEYNEKLPPAVRERGLPLSWSAVVFQRGAWVRPPAPVARQPKPQVAEERKDWTQWLPRLAAK